MLDLDDCYILGTNFHVHKFKKLFDVRVEPKSEDESEEDYNERLGAEKSKQMGIEENLCILQDGTIIGIRRATADKFLTDVDVENVRWGRKKMPQRLLMETPDDLYKLLSAVVPLDETVNYS